MASPSNSTNQSHLPEGRAEVTIESRKDSCGSPINQASPGITAAAPTLIRSLSAKAARPTRFTPYSVLPPDSPRSDCLEPPTTHHTMNSARHEHTTSAEANEGRHHARAHWLLHVSSPQSKGRLECVFLSCLCTHVLTDRRSRSAMKKSQNAAPAASLVFAARATRYDTSSPIPKR